MSPQESMVIAAARRVTDWYDRNDAAKANRRDFPRTEELSQLLKGLRAAVHVMEKVNA